MKTNDFNNITNSWELNTNIISVKINPLLKKKVTLGGPGQADQFCCWASTF